MIIKSILDTDLYKLTMGQVALFLFPSLKVKYKFIDRNKTKYPIGFDKKVKSEIEKLHQVKLSKKEKDYLTINCTYLTPAYIEFLNGYSFDPNEVDIKLTNDGELIIEIVGYWFRTIYWEVPLMAIISELYFIETNQKTKISPILLNNRDIIKNDMFIEHNVFYADMGTRRRYSFENQSRVLENFKKYSNHTFVGTSNVYFAQKLNIKAIGTLAHEFIMVHAAMYGYNMANKMSMDSWIKIYNGNLGTMLSDTYTTDIFLKSFDSKYAKLFDSVRHDSGDPFEFTDKIINHYVKLGIDPMSKTIIFSDGLNSKLACDIKNYCIGKIKTSFGIGTHFTNDVDVKPLNIVIKISDVYINDNWINTVKLSDNKTKNTGDLNEINLCKQILKIQ